MAYKHVDKLIQALKILVLNQPDLLLLIVGDGPERSALEKLIGQYRLQNNVSFCGFIKEDDEVIAMMKASKVFVLPSEREGFGIVAIEANAAGIPVVTVNSKGNAAQKLIKEDNGIVTKLSDSSLAEAISQMLVKSPDKAACRHAVSRFDWTMLTEKLKAVLL